MDTNTNKALKPKNKLIFPDIVPQMENIAICTGGDADSLNAGIGLSLYIEEKFNKKPYVIYTGDLEKLDHSYADYVEIRQGFKGKTVKMILDYGGTNIESLVWEKTDDSKLLLEVGPVNRSFNLDKISYDFAGKDVELIITVGIQSLESLNGFYKSHTEDFKAAQIVNIDVNKENKRYGEVNLVYPESDTLISLLLRKFSEWKYTPSARVSTILLYGLQKTGLSETEDLAEVPSRMKNDS